MPKQQHGLQSNSCHIHAVMY